MHVQRSVSAILQGNALWLSLALAIVFVMGLVSCSSGTKSADPVGDTKHAYSVGGTISGLEPKLSLKLIKNGTDELIVTSNGSFSFSQKLEDAAPYNISIANFPADKVCAVIYGASSIRSQDVSHIKVFCGPVPSGNFSAAASLNTGRDSHSATLLVDGKLLVAGGKELIQLSSAEIYDSVTDTWKVAGSMATPRYSHTATLLSNGNVLVAGGYNNPTYLDSAELYNPASDTWSSAGNMSVPRLYHTSTLLRNGKVLIVGGTDGSGLSAKAELYDPARNSWSSAGNLATARYMHTATLLPNGKVLVAAGSAGTPAIASAELYDPETNSWSVTGSLSTARAFHTEYLLPNGKVLLAGGFNSAIGSGPSSVLGSAELYDPATETWTSAGAMTYPRYAHTAISILLPTGKVILAGGGNTLTYLSSAEIYDPESNSWSVTGSLTNGRAFHTMSLLSNGRMLVVGGTASNKASVEIY